MIVAERNKLSFIFFSIALFSYGVFSYPFPRTPGIVEIIIGGLLVLATGVRGFWALFSFSALTKDFQKIRLSFWYLLLVPTSTMLVYGWETRDYIRDVIPLIYMFIPLLVMATVGNSKYVERLPLFVSIVGFLFSIRFFIEVQATPFAIGQGVLWDNKKYFSYDPTVLFGAIWFALEGSKNWGHSVRGILKSVIFIVASFVCFAALAGVIQRAPIALVVLACAFYFLRTGMWKLHKIVLLVIALLAAFYYLGALFLDVFDQFYLKQSLHGLNNKDSEFLMVLDVITQSLGVAFAGVGWGGIFYNPAYGMMMSNTHSLISYALIKTGILGTVAFIIMGSRVARDCLRLLSIDTTVALASSSALFIGLFFQPTYKTLSFGVILLIVITHGRRLQEH